MKEIRDQIRQLNDLTSQIKELDEELKVLKKRQRTFKGNIVAMLQDSELESCSTDDTTVSITTRTEYRVSDWTAFHTYIWNQAKAGKKMEDKLDAFDLLHKRASSTTLKEYFSGGKRPNGVEEIEWDELSVRKR